MFGNLGGAKSIHHKGGNNSITESNSMVNSNERTNSNKVNNIDFVEVESFNESKVLTGKQSFISEQKSQVKGRTESFQAFKPGKLDFSKGFGINLGEQ